ncbi:MAG: hypothetical protein ACREF3_02880, partial [Acetobacteraceae bacterium]
MRKLIVLAALFALSGPVMAASSHMTFHQRFEQANTTHDGHLTLDQAKSGMKSVARHFDAIDKDHRGYVTEVDIHSYYKAMRAAAHARHEGAAA